MSCLRMSAQHDDADVSLTSVFLVIKILVWLLDVGNQYLCRLGCLSSYPIHAVLKTHIRVAGTNNFKDNEGSFGLPPFKFLFYTTFLHPLFSPDMLPPPTHASVTPDNTLGALFLGNLGAAMYVITSICGLSTKRNGAYISSVSLESHALKPTHTIRKTTRTLHISSSWYAHYYISEADNWRWRTDISPVVCSTILSPGPIFERTSFPQSSWHCPLGTYYTWLVPYHDLKLR